MNSQGRFGWLAEMTDAQRKAFVSQIGEAEAREWDYHWSLQAHDGQIAPHGDWRIWMIMAGRGFGKTRAGAEWVRAIAETQPDARIALVSANLAEARSVMVEGESGILAICPPHRRPVYEPSLRRLTWPGGAQAHLYSAGEPESLRGPQHSHAWCDEIGKWEDGHEQGRKAWNNLRLGLRLGQDTRILATTTPRAVPLVLKLAAQAAAGAEIVLTRGTTMDNSRNLPERFLQDIAAEFGGTLLGRQEIDGDLIDEREGALWSRALIERSRETACTVPIERVVVAVDPPASAQGDACGIVVVALGSDGAGRVLADCSVEKASPERWARAVSSAAQEWQADRVIAEANQGGAMVESVLRAASLALPLRLVHATRGKSARAEPVAALYEAGRIRHTGLFAALEDQMCGMMAGGSYEGPGRSPDRADALVWALTELMLKPFAAPRVLQV